MNEARTVSTKYLITLLSCALNGQRPHPLPPEADWDAVFLWAKRNKVEATAWEAVKYLRASIPDGLAEKWQTRAYQTLHRQLLFDAERERVLSALKERGLSCLCLKGVYVCGYYPRPGMRYLCDNDILYGFVEPVRGGSDKEREASIRAARDAAVKAMEGLGYAVEYPEGLALGCKRPPLYNFELHRGLFSENTMYYPYWKNPWLRAVPAAGDPLEYRFSDEDEYLYLIAHAHKHYAHGGTGIRTLADEYVLCRPKEGMDWGYVEDELKKIGIAEFEEKLRHAAVHALSPEGSGKGKITEEDWDMITYMLGSGTYGTQRNSVKNALHAEQKKGEGLFRARLRYLKKRIWLDRTSVKNGYPFFCRHKLLLPVLPLYRTARALALRPARVASELRLLFEKDQEQGGRG